MAKNTPLEIAANDTSQKLHVVLANWAEAMNTRLRQIERDHSNLQTQLNTVVKKNTLVR